jgi:hypothetical protein
MDQDSFDDMELEDNQFHHLSFFASRPNNTEDVQPFKTK